MPELDNFCRDSFFMKLFLAMQDKEVKEHEFFIREKYAKITGIELGEINPDNFYMHWSMYGYANHFRERFEKHYQVYIKRICEEHCYYECSGIEHGGCRLSMAEIHKILEDGPGLPYEEKRELLSEPKELELLLRDE